MIQRLAPEPGQLVHARQRRWLVEEVAPAPSRGHATLVRAACVDDDAQGERAALLWEHELDAAVLGGAGWDRVAGRGFDDPELFAAYQRTLRWNMVTATEPGLFQSPFRAGIRLDAYQLEPLRKALLLPRVNLLLADDVGLGKTVEAGLIVRELLYRRRVDLVVVACPPSTLVQWQDELETRFGLRFAIVDRAFYAATRRERGFGQNPWRTAGLLLVSSRLLVDDAYASGLSELLGEFRARSLLVLDEAHHAAPASGRKYAIDSRITRAVRDLAPRFEHRLFLTATPHNGHPNSFAALMEILDPQRFVRGMEIERRQLDEVMVRRLKEDLRGLGDQGFPERVVEPVVIDGLPADAPELRLAAMLTEYRDIRGRRLAGESRARRAEAELVWIGLQQRLLSSVEAFARTLRVHEATLARALERGPPPARRVTRAERDLLAGTGPDDEAAGLDEAALEAEEEAAVAAATEEGLAGSGDEAWRRAVQAERAFVARMREVAEAHRHRPDARVAKLLAWVGAELCPGLAQGRGRWGGRRLLVFTEYEDTRRYLEGQLRAAIAGTDRAEERIATFTGATPQDRREAVKAAFNAAPAAHPLRILIATDAAREGINLQRHCADLFHFDLPWNPSRLEQRNGRIDRKLQPAPRVTCRYFVHAQRPEDRVLRRLVEKTEVIRRQLGSAAPVVETRMAEILAGGIGRAEAARLEAAIGQVEQDERQATAKAELAPLREADAGLARSLERLRSLLKRSGDRAGVDRGQLEHVVRHGLALAGGPPLDGGGGRLAFDPEAVARVRDPYLRRTLETLRRRPEAGPEGLRPVSFEPPEDTDADTVQLHLEHPLVARLLDRFANQGLVHHDLSRACLAVSPDAVPRVVLMGRLSLYGTGAARLHEEIVRVAARWVEPEVRKGALRSYAREAEAETMRALDGALDRPHRARVDDGRRGRLLATAARDVAELLPGLEARAAAAEAEAVARLGERGEREARDMRGLIERQRAHIERQLGADDRQLLLGLDPQEQRQRDDDRKAWRRRLDRIPAELEAQPAAVLAGYEVKARRLEPVGLVYLWPATG